MRGLTTGPSMWLRRNARLAAGFGALCPATRQDERFCPGPMANHLRQTSRQTVRDPWVTIRPRPNHRPPERRDPSARATVVQDNLGVA
jgi:hypothetical protein